MARGCSTSGPQQQHRGATCYDDPVFRLFCLMRRSGGWKLAEKKWML
eukprot:CAMPEP_0206418696 /NCGR_PEP_ID=MMETSP0294-20121207/38174_1 /ASSEMBLY_ACC=CAM_ASM_000327 /TAXON_ID=39354 /ORGANISM="Heterosigma akashiwo, Strain CCMP2393" /LENGTH=46 /DNA_ID= /DNA_START= /DNA_END= /DNA_ORIENTATION=